MSYFLLSSSLCFLTPLTTSLHRISNLGEDLRLKRRSSRYTNITIVYLCIDKQFGVIEYGYTNLR